MSNVNNSKSLDQYMNYGALMLANCQSVILFIERQIYDEYFPNINTNSMYFMYENKSYEYVTKNNVTYVFFNKKNNYLYEYINKATEFDNYIANNGKDTLEYVFTMCHKTEWLLMANTLLNYKKPVIWIDMGIYHIFKNNYKLFCDSMKYIQSDMVYNNKIIIGSIVDPTNQQLSDNEIIYKYPAWFFAGGVLGGMPYEIELFARLMKVACLEILDDKKHLMWEVNVWYLIYLKNPNLFNLYSCDHNSTILSNYK
jgi:hypothetical protein